MNKKEKEAIRKLRAVAQVWPNTLELFSDNGLLRVVKPEDKYRVLATINGIPNDGGDPDHYWDADGNEHIGHPEG